MSEANLLHLPVDILLNIFKKLSLSDLHSLMLTCKALRIIIANDSALWRWIFRHKLIIQNRTAEGYNEISRFHLSRISYNWRNGIYKAKLLIHHKTNYMPWLKYNPEVLLLSVGSELQCHPVDKHGFPNCNKTLWKFEVPSVERNDIRTHDISRFMWKNNLIVCGNRDGSSAIYHVNDIKKKPSYLQHIHNCHNDGQVEVSTVDILQNNHSTYMITASNNNRNVIFWQWKYFDEFTKGNLEKYTEVTLGEYEGIRCLAPNENGTTLALGPNGNNRPVLLDINTNTILKYSEELKNRKQMVRDIQWHDDNVIAYVSHSGILELMDMRTKGVVYHTRDPFQSTLYCVKTDGCNSLVVGSSEYSRCVLFDRRSSNHVQMFFTQKKSSPVYCLDFNASKLITAVDRSVAILNFSVSAKSLEPKDYSHIFKSVPYS